jgi:hypothetical protein
VSKERYKTLKAAFIFFSFKEQKTKVEAPALKKTTKEDKTSTSGKPNLIVLMKNLKWMMC